MPFVLAGAILRCSCSCHACLQWRSQRTWPSLNQATPTRLPWQLTAMATPLPASSAAAAARPTAACLVLWVVCSCSAIQGRLGRLLGVPARPLVAGCRMALVRWHCCSARGQAPLAMWVRGQERQAGEAGRGGRNQENDGANRHRHLKQHAGRLPAASFSPNRVSHLHASWVHTTKQLCKETVLLHCVFCQASSCWPAASHLQPPPTPSRWRRRAAHRCLAPLKLRQRTARHGGACQCARQSGRRRDPAPRA